MRALDVLSVAPDHATATLIFPDDFAEEAVLRLVGKLRRSRPHLLTLLVTRAPSRFRSFLCGEDRSYGPIILPKPLVGQVLLDTLRHRP
jgi:hypothetical protein